MVAAWNLFLFFACEEISNIMVDHSSSTGSSFPKEAQLNWPFFLFPIPPKFLADPFFGMIKVMTRLSVGRNFHLALYYFELTEKSAWGVLGTCL